MTTEPDLLSITAHGRTLRMYDTGGKIAGCWRKNGVPYERGLLEHVYRYRAGFDGIAVDAGANIGNHTLWFALVCGLPTVAFEPLQADILRQHVELNEAGDWITVVPTALSDQDGVAGHVGKGRLDPDRPAGTPHASTDHELWQRTSVGSVPTMTLDSFGLIDVGLIKIDVEGMETNVLRGAEDTILRDRPVIFAEEWGKKERTAIARVLHPWGYRRTSQFGKSVKMGRWDPWDG